jgi:organic radical activating enzyme
VSNIAAIELSTLKLQRVVLEVFGGCNYTCKMCPQGTEEGREPSFLRKMPLRLFEEILDQITPKYGKPVINLEGSGEPTLARDLPKYIQACTDRGLKSFIYCNGANFHGQYMRDCIDAGLTLIRFSVIGYNREEYKHWMEVDNWDLITRNVIEAIAYVKETGADCSIDSYHLIQDPNNADYELAEYRKNFIDVVGTNAYVWKMHNWAGNLEAGYQRLGFGITEKRSCGRPFAPELTIRAGGLKGHRGAVTPCCQTMGPPAESLSVLGHMDTQTFEEVWMGDLYENLRDAHMKGEFDRVPFCENCDFLIADPEVLVWSNVESVKLGRPLGTELNMNQ